MIPMLFIQPIVGFSVRHRHRTYTIEKVTPYTRKTDGAESCILSWSGECADCKEPLAFTTGGTKGNFQLWCYPCMKIRNAFKADARAAERVVENVPHPFVIWNAIRRIGGRPLSLAENAHRARHAPTVLRELCPELEQHTLAEIKEAVELALARHYIRRDTIGRRKNRHPIPGFRERPEWFLRQQGLWPTASEAPTPTGVFA